MGVPIEVYRLLRYESGECAHDVVLQAGRPGWPNHDQGAADAADAFVDSALSHLKGWFEEWQLPRMCPNEHTITRDEPREDLYEPPAADYLLTDRGVDAELRP